VLKRATQDYTVKQNHLLQEHIKVQDDFPLLPPLLMASVCVVAEMSNRFMIWILLRSRLFDKLKNDFELHEFVGKDRKESGWGFFYKTIEFWLVAAVVVNSFCMADVLSAKPVSVSF
jgi:uncharacterized membrane protein YbaN (DUF454 family)